MNYYIADCHFGHKNILRFDHRPFGDLYQMEEVMVMLWNAAVKKEDTVYILGDFCWGKADEWLRILNQLNGQKVLIEGNHDLGNYPAELKKCFLDIKPYKEISDNGRKVIMSHYPIPFYRHSGDPNMHMLCGHVHNTAENACLEKWTHELRHSNNPDLVNRGQIYNVGCMMPWMDYAPRCLDEIVKRWGKHHSA